MGVDDVHGLSCNTGHGKALLSLQHLLSQLAPAGHVLDATLPV
jgi:hypothetical protein